MTTSLDLESLHRRASGHYLRGEFDAATRVWRELLEHAPKDVRASEGVRLCEELAREAPVEGHTPDVPASAFLLDVPLADLAGPRGQELRGFEAKLECEPEPEASFAEEFGILDLEDGGDAAALELGRRVEQLVEDAQASAQRGEGLEALKIIDRVLILDEENQAALELRARLTGPPPSARSGSNPLPAAAIDPDPIPDPADLDMPEPKKNPAPRGTTWSPPSSPGVFLKDQAPAQSAEPTPSTAPSVAASAGRASLRRSWARLATVTPRGRAAWIAGAVLLAGGMGGGAWWAFADRPADPAAAEARPDARPAAPAPAPVAEPPAPSGPVAPRHESPSAVIARGDAAAAGKDWAAAVLAYDQAAKLAPEDLEVRKKFQVAAAAYQVQRKEQERWDEAFLAFESGNYEEALRCFYRMPGSETDPRIVEHTVRSWFNLGVNALRGHDCRAAVSHFGEAQAIRPADREIQTALALAKDCGKANAVTFPLEVAALKTRPLAN